MSDRLVTRLDLRVGLLLAAIAVVVLVVYAGTRWILTMYTPSVCVSSMIVEQGEEPITNPVTCLP